MQKIHGPFATNLGTFVDEVPGATGTFVTADWLNAVQGELLATIAAGGLTPSDLDNAQFLAACSVIFAAGIGAGGLKNRAINGAFELFQRGLSRDASNAEVYVADRWAGLADALGAGTGTATITRQDFATGQTEVPLQPAHFLRWTQTLSSSSAAPTLAQKVEDVSSLANGNLAVSVWLKGDVNHTVTLSCTQKFGSGGSGDVVVGSQAFSVTTTWQRFTKIFAVPSIAGATVGAGSHTRLSLALPSGQLFTVDVADFQLERSNTVSQFDRRPLELELLLAKRYFEKSYDVDVAPGTSTRAGPSTGMTVSDAPSGNIQFLYALEREFAVLKRGTPTVVWFAPDVSDHTQPIVGNIQVFWLQGGGTINIPVVQTVDPGASSTGFPKISSGAPVPAASRWPMYAHWTADAEL